MKWVEDVKMLAYHFREKPWGGNVTSAVGVKEAITMTTSGATRKIITRMATSVQSQLTRRSRIFSASHPFHISACDQDHDHLDR